MSFNVSQYSREKKNNDQAPVTGQSGPGINLSELARQAAALDAERRRREQEEAALSRSGPSRHSSSSRAAQERAEAWNSLGVIDKAKDVIGTTARGTGAQIMANYAGAEAALAGEGTILNDTYALGRSMLDRNDGVSAWDAFDAYGNLFIQRGGGVLPNALDRLYDKAGALAGKAGIQLDTENDMFSRWNNYLQDKKAAAEKAFFDKVGEVDNIYTAGQRYRQQKLNEIQQEAQQKYSNSKAAQNIYKYGTMVGTQVPNAVAAVLTAFLMPEAAPGVVGGIAGTTTGGLQAYSAAQAAGKGAQTLNALRAGISGMTNNPNFWTAAVNETGAAYNEAIEAGVDPARASTYATTYGLFSATVEVGGVDELLGGMQAFPKNIRKAIEEKNIAKAAWEYGKSIVEEIGEEEVQGMLQNAMKGGMLGQDAPLYSTENPNAIINPKQMLETARDTAITTAILGAGERAMVGGAQKIADSGTYYGGSEQTIRAAMEAAETEAEKNRVAGIQKGAAVRAEKEGKGADYRLSIGEARELQEIVRKKQGEEKAGKILAQGSIENAYRGMPIDKEGNTLSKGEQEALASLYDPQKNESKTYYPAAYEAYQLGYMSEKGKSLSLAEAKSAAELSGYLTERQFEQAWRLGALRRVGDVEKAETVAHLKHYGDENARKLAAVHDGLTTAEEYAEIVDKAVFYAKNGADLQTVVEETRNESSTAKWAQDRELGKLTDEQIAVIQELGPQLAAQDREAVRKTAEAFAGIREAAAEANTLTQVNKQLAAARNGLESARTELQAAEKEMRQMQDSGAWSTEEEAYNAVVRRVEELDGIIENGEKLVRDLEAKREEAQKTAPQKRKKGTVSFDESVDQKNLNRQQKKNIAAVQALADVVNIDYVLYAGKQKEGGYYVDGQIYMNINAAVDVTANGQETKMSIFGFTLSHELTHHLKKYAPEEYQALRDFVVEKIRAEKGEKGLSQLVQEQISMEKGAKKLSYDQAVDELVANSCITMLRDSETVKELARQNMTLAEKIADFLEDFVGKLRAAFEGADIHSNHRLFNAAKAMEKEAEGMLQLWDAALKTADVNYNAAQSVGKLSPATGSNAQYMAWEEEEISSIKEQLKANEEALSKMEPVARLESGIAFDSDRIYDAVEWASKQMGLPLSVGRKEIGTVQMTRKRINRGFNYIPKGRTKAVSDAFGQAFTTACPGIPEVIRNGRLIGHHQNHKKRGYPTWTYAAPVLVDGERGILAVVVKKTTDNFYDVHSILTPDGKFLALDRNKAEASAGGASTEDVAPAMLPASEDIVPNKAAPVKQGYTSADTSINSTKVPVLYKDKNAVFVRGGTNIDIGGGRFDTATDYLREEKGTTNLIFDPFNRSEENNAATLRRLIDGNLADTATCSNVLNVIDSPEARANVILEMAKAIKPDGKAYFTVYEGTGKEGAKQSKADSWQENRKTESYVPEIRLCFEKVERKGKLIIAENPKPGLPKAAWETSPGNATMFMAWDGMSEDDLLNEIKARQEERRGIYEKEAEQKAAYEEMAAKVVSGSITPEEYKKWETESGYGKAYTRRLELDREIRELYDAYDQARNARLEEEEQEAIKASGLSEEEYFRNLAVKEFGYTPYFYDGGYLLPNGKLLNFSGEKGKHYGSRGQDHRAIEAIYASSDRSDAMNRFINQGNIRMMPESPGMDMSTQHEPSAQQYATIRNFVRKYSDEGYLSIDFTGENGNVKASLVYEENIRPDRVVNDIKHFYQTGEVRDQGVSAWFMTWGDQVSFEDLMDENVQMSMDDLEDEALPGEGQEEWRRNDRAAAKTMPGMEKVPAQQGPRRERALATAITGQTKKLLEGYTPTDWDRSITAEDIDGWLDADEYHGVMGSMFDDGMQAADLLYDLAQAQPEKAEDAYLVMEQLAWTMNPVYAQVYTVPGGYDRTPGFTDWYMRRNPSVYYPGYKPGDLFEDTLFGEGNTTKEIEYLNELLNRPEVSPEKKAEAQAFLDRLTRKPEEWSVRAGDEIRDYKEAFYMSWDNDHNDWAPEFYSKLNRTVAEWTNDKGRPMPEKMGAGAVIPWLRGRGVKAEEIRWSGLQPWLEGRKSVTKDELAAYLAGNMIDIRTEVRGRNMPEYLYDVRYDPLQIGQEHFRDADDLEEALDKIEDILSKREGKEVYVKTQINDDGVAFYYLKPNGEKEHVLRATMNDAVDSTKWSDYTMKGGYKYREILFVDPRSNYDNMNMRVHWGRPGVLAHARVQDMEEVSEGKQVLFIEELQSDWHNAGAKKDPTIGKAAGFASDYDNSAADSVAKLVRERIAVQTEGPKFEEIDALARSLLDRVHKADEEKKYQYSLSRVSILDWLTHDNVGILDDNLLWLSDEEGLQGSAEKLTLSLMSEEEKDLMKQSRDTYRRVRELTVQEQEARAVMEERPPEAPFAGSSDTYHEYVMKHLLRLAAEGDYDAIGWTTAEQQAERWKDPDTERWEKSKESYRISYDQTLPKFMNKYTKQWGGKVGDMALAVPYTNGQETRVWAVEITPEMKKAVLHEGQPLFMSWDGMEDTEQEWQARLEAYSRLEAEQAIQDQVFQSIRELTRSQKKSLAEIQKRLKIGKTPEARMEDVQRMARSLMSRYNSTMKEEDVVGEIAAIWNYVLQDQDPSGNVVRNMAEELAEKIVDSAEVDVIDETEEETLKEIRNRIRGQKLVIGADETGDIPGYANLAEFRKKNFGRFSVAGRNSDAVTDQHVPVDSLYEELRNSYGDYYFPESTSQGEMLGVLSGYFDATERQTANPFADSYGEAVEAIAGEITRSAWWDAVRLTPLTEAEQAKVRNAEGREIIQSLRDERKITKSQAEKLEKPMADEERLAEQAEALKAQIRELVEAGEMSKAEAAELQASLLKMTRRVDTLEEQYRLLEEAADKRVAQIREEGAAKVAEAIAKQQEKNAKNVQALKDHFKEVQQNARARREESGNVKKYREQVTKKAKKLFELLMTNSDKKHVPEVLKGPLAQFLTELDFTSKRQLRGGDETKNDRAFAANLQRLEQILSNQQAYISGDPNAKSDLGGYIDVSPDNLEYLRQVSELITKALTRGETFTVNSMTGAQLKDLSKLLSNLYTAINRMNDFMANARYESVREAAAGDIGYFNSLGEAGEKAESRWRNWVYWKDGVPYYVFNRFGEGGKSIFDGFTRGWEKLAFRAQEIIDFTEKLYTDKEVAEWTKDLHEFTLEDGSKIRMTTAQVMELSMLLGREQAQKHIMKGGIRIGTVRTKKGAVNDTNHYHLTAGDIANIAGSLTARQAEVARALQRFMAEKGAEWGNEISMRRFGYNFYTEGENYYPIRTDPSDRPMSDTDMPQNASMFRLLNLSSSKALNPKASNALIVGDIFDTFANHTSDMAKLNAMGLPVLDAIKWFNYKERVNINMETGEHTTKTLQRAMERAYGTQAGHYFRTLMKDINGVVEAGDRGADIWSNLTARYKAVAVGANLRVALLQPTSYLRALNVIDGKYLAAAFAHRNAYKEAMQYSGTAVWKSMGYYDTDISKGMRGQIKHDDSWRDKVVEASMKAAEIGDKRTWGRLWVACKLQTKAQNPGLNGEELKQATADLFRKTIYASQVMDSTLTRSEMMRSKSLGDKLLTPFMAEPTLSFNILMDAYSNYSLDERRLGKAEAWKKNAGLIGRALTAYVATAAFNALAESIWDAVRDDDDEEFLEKFKQALFGEDNLLEGNLVQDISILNKIPGVKDVISMLTGYTNRNIATEGIENIVNAAKIWQETWQLANGTLEKATKITYYGRMTEWGRIYKSLQALSQVTGLPIYPLTREVVAIWNTLMNGRKDEWKILTYDANQLSESALAAWSETVQPTGISQGQFKKIMNEADANGSVQPTQDELGEYLTAALADGTVTEEQAQALWNSRGWSDEHDFNWWREKGGGAEAPAEISESAQAAPKTEAKAETKKAETGTKPAANSIPVYSAKREATMAAKPAGMSEGRYAEILRAADTDANDSLKQDELGAALKRAVERREMSHEEAKAVWDAQGWSAKHSYEWWLSRH